MASSTSDKYTNGSSCSMTVAEIHRIPMWQLPDFELSADQEFTPIDSQITVCAFSAQNLDLSFNSGGDVGARFLSGSLLERRYGVVNWYESCAIRSGITLSCAKPDAWSVNLKPESCWLAVRHDADTIMKSKNLLSLAIAQPIILFGQTKI